MQLIPLPGSDLHVSSLALGTSEFGSKIDRAAAFRLLDQFVAAGGNFVDTANVYGDWVPRTKSSSEKVIGAWLAQRGNRAHIVLATKGGHPDLAHMDRPRLDRRSLHHDVDQSLRHLRTDVIDLYWLHRDDPAQPVGAIMDTLAELQQAGKIRAVGCSNWRTDRIAAAQAHAAQTGIPGFVANQMLWNMAVLDRRALSDPSLVAMDADMLRYHTQTGLAAVPFTAQAGGLFQKLAQGETARIAQRYPIGPNQARLAQAQTLAQTLGVSLTGIALGYLQSHPFPTVPIVGCRTPQQLADTLAGTGVQLTAAQIAQLNDTGS